jgi:phosphatidylinositol glycan class H protein
MCFSTTHRFIPLSNLNDMIINEGLKGWDVRYYLAVIKHVGGGGFAINIAFEVSQPTLFDVD